MRSAIDTDKDMEHCRVGRSGAWPWRGISTHLCTVQVQFVKTGGIYAKMRRETPGKPDPLPELQKKLMAAVGTSDEMFPLTLNYTIFMLLAKDPQPL